MGNFIAQVPHTVGPISGGEVAIDGGGGPVDTFTRLISAVIGLLTIIAILYFIFMLITGAVAIIGSGGDQGKYEDARRKITTGAIGLVVVISAMFLIGLIGILLDIPILNIGDMITRIRL